MKAFENRAIAREKLTGKWRNAAIQVLIFAIIEYVISLILQPKDNSVGSILSAIISVPISYGFLVSMIKLYNDEEFGYFEFLTYGFSNFIKAWSVSLNIFLKLIIPVILIIVSASILTVGFLNGSSTLTGFGFVFYIASIVYLIIKSISYTLSFYILYENSEISGKEAVEKSAELMKGNVWAWICLSLSFIGWLILAALTVGIGLLWLIPYMQLSKINFYKYLTGDVSIDKSNVTDIEEDPIKNQD